MFGAGPLAFQTKPISEANHSSLLEEDLLGCLLVMVSGFVAANALRVDQPAESEVGKQKFKRQDPPASYH
jgi:hypothetical protein